MSNDWYIIEDDTQAAREAEQEYLQYERFQLAVEALRECHAKGVSDHAIRTLCYEAGVQFKDVFLTVGDNHVTQG